MHRRGPGGLIDRFVALGRLKQGLIVVLLLGIILGVAYFVSGSGFSWLAARKFATRGWRVLHLYRFFGRFICLG